MSTQVPTTASELSAIAEAASQLGIKNENLISFTETMANLGVAAALSSLGLEAQGGSTAISKAII